MAGLGPCVRPSSSPRRQAAHAARRCAVLIVAATALWVSPAYLAAGNGTDQIGAPARTGKERLTDKASDEQRVNDCKVPPAKRTRPRATDCQGR
jgi:hypothetical protein